MQGPHSAIGTWASLGTHIEGGRSDSPPSSVMNSAGVGTADDGAAVWFPVYPAEFLTVPRSGTSVASARPETLKVPFCEHGGPPLLTT